MVTTIHRMFLLLQTLFGCITVPLVIRAPGLLTTVSDGSAVPVQLQLLLPLFPKNARRLPFIPEAERY